MSNLIEEIQQIHEIAIRYAQLRLDEDKLLEYVNNNAGKHIDKIGKLYQHANDAQPVNLLRKNIIFNLEKEKLLTQEWLTDQKDSIENRTGKKSFKAYSMFSILYPVLHVINPIDVKKTLSTLGNSIIKKLELQAFVAEPHIVDFRGPRSFGADRVWMAIYNKSHPNQTTALQFFFLIDQQGYKCSLYDRFTDTIVDQRKIEVNTDLVRVTEEFFKQHVKKLADNFYNSLKNRTLPIKGQRLFKLSHGTDYFSLEEIQACLNECIAVVHEETKAKGRQNFSQYELFREAKRGDFFYSSWGNNQFLVIGQFVDDEIIDYKYGDDNSGWKQRKYRQLYSTLSTQRYTGDNAWWTPSNNSTFVEINQRDFPKANKNIFIPFFRVELDDNQEAELAKTARGIASGLDVVIDDQSVAPKLDVSLVATEFARLIYNLKKNKGQFLGVFGRWGRGKTFFAEEVFGKINESLKAENIIRHQAITFNAWKYQDTEAIWAYIYETLSTEYLSLAEGNWWKEKILTFKLNKERKGAWPIYILVLSILANLLWIIWIPFSWKVSLAIATVSNFGLVGTYILWRLYKRYYPKIKETAQEYTNNPGFGQYLGAQAEIQEELKTLLKVWFNLKTHHKKAKSKLKRNWPRNYDRIIFFVDDIDRCQEDKIISIIDSLRVMLEDDEIVERIIVMAAIDETILERAILWKYRDLIDNTLTNDNSKTSNGNSFKDVNELTREYMDKLFIGGIKLPKLSSKEQFEILENYALEAKILEKDPYIISTEIDTEDNSKTEDTSDLSVPHEITFPESIYDEYVLTQTDYFLLQSELDYLHEKISENTDLEITPRQLRIYLNRYLLAKNVASAFLFRETGERELGNPYCTFIIECIAARTFNPKYKLNIAKLKEVSNSPVLHDFTIKLIKMVVPY